MFSKDQLKVNFTFKKNQLTFEIWRIKIYRITHTLLCIYVYRYVHLEGKAEVQTVQEKPQIFRAISGKS